MNYRNVSLVTGKSQVTKRPIAGGVRPGVTPAETLKVVEWSKQKPTTKRVRMGAVTAIVGSDRIRFRRAERDFTGEEDDPVPSKRFRRR